MICKSCGSNMAVVESRDASSDKAPQWLLEKAMHNLGVSAETRMRTRQYGCDCGAREWTVELPLQDGSPDLARARRVARDLAARAQKMADDAQAAYSALQP